MRGWLVSASLVLLASGSRTVAGQANATAPLTALQAYLAENGKAAAPTGRIVIKANQTIESFDGCDAVIRVRDENDVYPMIRDFRLRLSEVSPEVSVRKFQDADLEVVTIVSTSGESTIPAVHYIGRDLTGEKKTADWRFVELVANDRVTADTIAMYLREAIRACGGNPRTSAAEQRAAAGQRENNRASDALLGKDIPPEERSRIIAGCEAKVREQLKTPSTARFDPNPSIMRSAGSSTMLALGKVSAQNAVGGTRDMSYICTLELYGKRWTAKSAVLQ